MLKSCNLSRIYFLTVLFIILSLGVPQLFAEEAGQPMNPGTLNHTRSEVCDMNTLGQAVGWAYTATGEVHAFLWDRGVITDLGTLGGPGSRAFAINENGQVVGWAETAAGEMHAFLWENGVMEDLGTLGGSRSEALRIYDLGQVVGRSETPTGEVHSFIWENGEMFDLNIAESLPGESYGISGTGKKAGISETYSSVGAGAPVSLGGFNGENSGTTLTDEGQFVQGGRQVNGTSPSAASGSRQSASGTEGGISPPDPQTMNAGNPSGSWLDERILAYWNLGGNAGTNPLINFIGTTDNQPLILKVNGKQALRLEPTGSGGLGAAGVPGADTCPNLIGGYSGNQAFSGVKGASIGGGGDSALPNRVTDDYGTIGGGGNNQAGDGDADTTNAPYATVGGGKDNSAIYDFATVGGGRENTANYYSATVGGGNQNTALGGYATVGGGRDNAASGDSATVAGGINNTASSIYATVAGGVANTASGDSTTVGGGDQNAASGSFASVAGGGYQNYASGSFASVGGGRLNTATGTTATVGGGNRNTAYGVDSTVGGGSDNTAAGRQSTVGGGEYNYTSAYHATIAGGGPSNTGDPTNTNNRVTDNYGTIGGGGGNQAGNGDGDWTNAIYATVPGGYWNTADGDYSFAAGCRAKANHDGAFVWADSTDADFTSTAADQFLIRASGGVGIGTASPIADLEVRSYSSESSMRIASDAPGETSLQLFEMVGTTPYGFEFFYDGNTGADKFHLWSIGFSSNEAIRMTWLKNGNVGIGTTGPENKLHVNGAINLDPIAAPSNPTTGFVIYVDSADGDLKAKAATGTVTVLAID